MHIELTDHLRCPMSHEESFVVLLPDRMEGRLVTAGHLGCPTCGWGTAWTDAIPDFGGGTPGEGGPAFDAAAALALLGLEGPGGWLALAGRAGALARDLVELLPGVGIVAVNPPAQLLPDAAINVIRSAVWPLKRHSMRGVVVGGDAAAQAPHALASALPGLRVAGEGTPPPLGVGDELLADAGGVWVIRKG
jgi:hypothetical protein